MSANLKKFLARLAIDPDLFTDFVADPGAAARNAGLNEQDQQLLVSGDQNRIYAALIGQAGPDIADE